MRPTGIELVSPAPQAGALSIELWALKSVCVYNLLNLLADLSSLFILSN